MPYQLLLQQYTHIQYTNAHTHMHTQTPELVFLHEGIPVEKCRLSQHHWLFVPTTARSKTGINMPKLCSSLHRLAKKGTPQTQGHNYVIKLNVYT